MCYFLFVFLLYAQQTGDFCRYLQAKFLENAVICFYFTAKFTKEGRVSSSMSIKTAHTGYIAITRAKVCNHTAKALIAVQRF